MKQIRTFLVGILVFLFLADVATAQLFRRRPQRTAPPILRGDGRLLERVGNAVNLFTESGKELKPVAVFSVASFDEIKKTSLTVAEKIRLNRGSDEQPIFLDKVLKAFETVVAQGFGTSQPLGCILQTDGLIFYPILFTPLKLDGEVGQTILPRIAEPLKDGRYALKKEVFAWPFGQLYVQQHGDWVFIAMEQQLSKLPDDPTALLQGLDKNCLAAARFDLFNMPKLPTKAALAVGEMNGVAQAKSTLEKAWVRLGIGYLRSLAEQADFLEYTLAYDDENNDFVVTQRETVRPKTERYRLLQARREAESEFHGFYHPDRAILAAHLVMPLTKSQREQLEIILDETVGAVLLTEEERDALQGKKTAQATGISTPRLAPPEPTESTPPTPQVLPAFEGNASDRLAALLAQSPPESMNPPTEDDQPEPAKPLREFTAPALETVPTPAGDASVRLAELLAPSATERPPTEDDQPEPISQPELANPPKEPLNDAQKLRVIVRSIAKCYYYALLASVRNGYLDGATTLSQEHGLIGVYNIIGGTTFRNSFDDLLAGLAEHYPDVFDAAVRKDYAEAAGFSLTSISIRPDDLFANAPWIQAIPPNVRQRETTILLGVREDAICYAVGPADQVEDRLLDAVFATNEKKQINDLFFIFSVDELGQAIADSGDPNRLPLLKSVLADGNPAARAYAVSHFTDTTKTLTLRISGLMTPSLWRLRDGIRSARNP